MATNPLPQSTCPLSGAEHAIAKQDTDYLCNYISALDEKHVTVIIKMVIMSCQFIDSIAILE